MNVAGGEHFLYHAQRGDGVVRHNGTFSNPDHHGFFENQEAETPSFRKGGGKNHLHSFVVPPFGAVPPLGAVPPFGAVLAGAVLAGSVLALGAASGF